MKKKITLHYLRNRFLTGLFLTVPIALTVWILAKIIQWGDSFLDGPIQAIFGYKIFGLGFILSLLAILGIGILANNYIGRKLTDWIGKVFAEMPIISSIYNPIKEVVLNIGNEIGSEKSSTFMKAVLVDFPRLGTQSIGFITRENVRVNGEVYNAIFVPTTPNPTTGFLMYLKPGTYQELDVPVDKALKAIITLGATPLK